MSLIVLTLCLAAVIQLRSSQPTVATEQDIDVGGTSGQTDHILSVLNQLVSSMSEIQSGMTQLQTAVAELQSSNARLQSDVAELNVVFSRRGCSANFTYISSVNGCYKVLVTREMNWYAAARACQSLHEDAHLLVINDAREQSAVANMPELTGCWGLWTAGYRAAGASTFVWNARTNSHNTVTDMTYTNWLSGQPDTSGDACVYLYRPHRYRWHDGSCTYAWPCPVCQVDL